MCEERSYLITQIL